MSHFYAKFENLTVNFILKKSKFENLPLNPKFYAKFENLTLNPKFENLKNVTFL